MPNTSHFSDLFKIILSIRDDPVGPVRGGGRGNYMLRSLTDMHRKCGLFFNVKHFLLNKPGL